MVDVFILAAKADRGRVAPLAQALTARGFSVASEDGPAFAGLDQAKVALVLWTASSIKDPAVLAAAAAAGERMAPVLFDPVQPPAAFAQRASDVLTAWPRAAGQGPFERLVLKLEGMTAVTAQPASAVPQGILDEALAARQKLEKQRAFWPTIGRIAGLSAVVAIGGTIWLGLQQTPTPPPLPEQTLCGAAQRYCLSEDDLKLATEGGLISKALEKASREDIVAGATDGDVLSMGLLCLADALVDKDGAAAAESCKAAAQANSPLGNIGLATLFTQGIAPTPQDPAAAAALLAAAAAQGDARAQFLQAELAHADGDFAAALTALNACGPAGYKPCRFLRAFMLANGQGGPADVREAVRMYTELAAPENSFPAAARNLGYIYENGAPPEIAANLSEALALYRRAAAFGDGFSHFRLGVLAEAGVVPGEGPQEAIAHYRAAVEAGQQEAAAPLAALEAAQLKATGSVKK